MAMGNNEHQTTESSSADAKRVPTPEEQQKAYNLWMAKNVLADLASMTEGGALKGVEAPKWLKDILKLDDSREVAARLDELVQVVWGQAEAEDLPKDLWGTYPQNIESGEV